ncbi:hypothetical protein [Aporhodopirellula aestuarii]|uniref:Uncharacterized protein n=1 Tax=Aporhodopirellula aestuarii TaxID=2950107 RepID=A0ABT0U554_9BACT|nr:hypothetical protein [Aporhodopirellula aestuarii]MCM2371976.1 hypothetical protein [Aporhodopirellula aestuarii]
MPAANEVEGVGFVDDVDGILVGKPVGTPSSGPFIRLPANAYGLVPVGGLGVDGVAFELTGAVPPAIDAIASGVARADGGVG